MNFFSDNKLNKFRTRLPRRFTLDGRWEVGLVEIQYPRNWYQIKKHQCWLKLRLGEDEDWLVLPLRQAYYKNEGDIRQELRNALAQIPGADERITIAFSRPQRTLTVIIRTRGTALQFSPCLRTILGFDSVELTGIGRYTSNTVVDLNQGFHSLYVYCDILDNRVVGDTMAPLLRVVSVQGEEGSHVCQSFDNIEYVPLGKKDFQELELNIRTDFGEPVPFERGKVVVTLHFRRLSPQLW